MSNFDEWRRNLSPDGRAEVEARKEDFREGARTFRAIREFIGIDQAEAARRMSRTQGNVSKMERHSSHKINLDGLRMLAGDDYAISIEVRRISDGEVLKIEI